MKMILNYKQAVALDLMESGKNVFITGPSGTGKSTLIHIYKSKYGTDRSMAITSTTGISALLIGGVTLHSYLGIGLGNMEVDKLYGKIEQSKFYKRRWKKLDTLVIDEISMLSPELFDKLEEVARRVRGINRAFGGIQLVLTGDFLQLPVVKNERFCFEAEQWGNCVSNTVYLDSIERQKDEVFQRCLNELRVGNITEEVKNLLKSRENIELTNDRGIQPTIIHTTNHSVDNLNETHLDKLGETEFFEYEMSITVHKKVFNTETVIETYKKNCTAPHQLQLCKGAQVMLLHNLDLEDELANGSRGVVVGFSNELPVVKFLNGKERVVDYHSWEYDEGEEDPVITLNQIPLKLAWSITCHKSQGQTLDYAVIDLKNVFEYAQAYVALSRVRTIEGLSIRNLKFHTIKAHPKAIEFYRTLCMP